MSDKTAEMLFADALAAFPGAAVALAAAQPRFARNGRRINGGDGSGFSTWDPTPLKFVARVTVGSERDCWPWTGNVAKSGYGTLHHDYAHRLAWQYAVGPIPAGLTIDHLCYVTTCCNPAHMQLVTLAENARRQRPFRKTHCKRGHDLRRGENVYWSRAGRRTCKACARANMRAYLARKRAAA